jgi:hypothetical protein
MCVWACVHVCVSVCVCVCVYVYIYTYICESVCVCIYIYIRTHTYIHTYIHACIFWAHIADTYGVDEAPNKSTCTRFHIHTHIPIHTAHTRRVHITHTCGAEEARKKL